jgi:lysozyme family protein
VTIGAPANHFPTPSVGDGLLLAASAEHVVAFAAQAPGARSAPATAGSGPGSSGQAQTAPTHTPRNLAAIVFVAAAVLIGLGWLVVRRLRRTR